MEEILESSTEVAEGVDTSIALVKLIKQKFNGYRMDLKYPILFGIAAILQGQLTPREVLYLPFSALFRYSEFLNTRNWRDDIIIEGDYTHAGDDGDDNIVTILTDSYRQERLR